MTDPRSLFVVPQAPALLLLASDAKAGAEAAWGWREAGLFVRLVRGRKMRTVDDLFDEMAAALQFPYYFGENWAAFDECLSDMDWLPMAAGIVVVINDPLEVLADSADVELSVFLRAIFKAVETYSRPIALGEWRGRPAVPFHVVLQSVGRDVAAITQRWAGAGALVVPFPT